MHKYRVTVFKNGFATDAYVKSNKNYNNYFKWIVKRCLLANRMKPRIVVIDNRIVVIDNRIVYDPDFIDINEIKKDDKRRF